MTKFRKRSQMAKGLEWGWGHVWDHSFRDIGGKLPWDRMSEKGGGKHLCGCALG